MNSQSSAQVDCGYAPRVEPITLDTQRADRTGDPEVVYGRGKTPEHVVQCLRGLHEAHPHRAVLATRLDDAALARLAADLPAADLDPLSRTAVLGPLPTPVGAVAVVSAGTADTTVAREVVRTLAVHGAGARIFDDVGVAGLHRVLAVRDDLAACDVLVVVAGMEGALPSVVGGLTGLPLVAVPTSTGYGTGADGLAAVLAMLNSCAPGVVVVNIDNGYGAGVHAARIARALDRATAGGNAGPKPRAGSASAPAVGSPR